LITIESRKSIPPLLFRAFAPRSGGRGAKNGHPLLNTKSGIVPNAFLQDSPARGNEQWTLSNTEIGHIMIMVDGHVNDRKLPKGTEFSSWASSFLLALQLAYVKWMSQKEGYVAIIDTKTIAGGNLHIYHAPALLEALSKEVNYRWEYLVHSIVTGHGYYCVSIKEIIDLGFFDLYENVYRTTFPDEQDHFGLLSRQTMFGVPWITACPPAEITYPHALMAKKMAVACVKKNTESVNEEMLVMFTVAFLGLRTRFWDDLEDQRCMRDGDTIIKVLRENPVSCGIPVSLKEDASIMTDCVFVDGYPEVEQMIRMLRALALRAG
jgi:hypothetical protein